MPRSSGSTRKFLLDTNVFVAAVKNPERQTDTLRLLLRIVSDPDVELVGNVLLAEELSRYAELLGSERAALLVSALLAKMEIAAVTEGCVKACRAHVPTPDKVDVLHAATCLQTGAAMITNDRHFDKIKAAGIIEVLGLGEAIKKLL